MTETLIFKMARARDRSRKPRIHQGRGLIKEMEVPVIEERDVFNAFVPTMVQFFIFKPRMKVSIVDA